VLRTRITGDGRRDRAQALDHAGTLSGPEGRGSLEVESHLDPGARAICMLAAWATRGIDAPVEFIQRNSNCGRDPQVLADSVFGVGHATMLPRPSTN